MASSSASPLNAEEVSFSVLQEWAKTETLRQTPHVLYCASQSHPIQIQPDTPVGNFNLWWSLKWLLKFKFSLDTFIRVFLPLLQSHQQRRRRHPEKPVGCTNHRKCDSLCFLQGTFPRRRHRPHKVRQAKCCFCFLQQLIPPRWFRNRGGGQAGAIMNLKGKFVSLVLGRRPKPGAGVVTLRFFVFICIFMAFVISRTTHCRIAARTTHVSRSKPNRMNECHMLFS